jgi:hypothetical protein
MVRSDLRSDRIPRDLAKLVDLLGCLALCALPARKTLGFREDSRLLLGSKWAAHGQEVSSAGRMAPRAADHRAAAIALARRFLRTIPK